MGNIYENSSLINTTFDEMIAQWTRNGCYNLKMVNAKKSTNLQTLRLMELFLNDIEYLKTDLFLERSQYIRNSDSGFNLNKIKTIYEASRYAKKWFPFDFLLQDFIYLNYFNNYVVNELSMKVGMLYYAEGFNFKGVSEQNGDNKYIKLRNKKLDVEKKILRMSIVSSNNIQDLSEESIIFLNKIVRDSNFYIKNAKSKGFLNNGLLVKRKGYIEYFIKLLNKYNGLTCCSINFYLINNSISIDYFKIRKNFMNNLRSKSSFKNIVGYMGTWEYSRKYGYYFRTVFFIPRKIMNDLTSFIDEIIYYWESFDSISSDKDTNKITFKAEAGNLSESISLLNKSMCVIGSKNKKLIKAFVEGVINYTTFAENYFFPADLQIFLYEISPDKYKIQDDNGNYLVSELKFNVSRSFRGNLKNS